MNIVKSRFNTFSYSKGQYCYEQSNNKLSYNKPSLNCQEYYELCGFDLNYVNFVINDQIVMNTVIIVKFVMISIV